MVLHYVAEVAVAVVGTSISLIRGLTHSLLISTPISDRLQLSRGAVMVRRPTATISMAVDRHRQYMDMATLHQADVIMDRLRLMDTTGLHHLLNITVVVLRPQMGITEVRPQMGITEVRPQMVITEVRPHQPIATTMALREYLQTITSLMAQIMGIRANRMDIIAAEDDARFLVAKRRVSCIQCTIDRTKSRIQ